MMLYLLFQTHLYCYPKIENVIVQISIWLIQSGMKFIASCVILILTTITIKGNRCY